MTKKERKKKGVTSSRFEIWYGQKPREKKKERKTRLKKKKREREKEREEKLFSPIVKKRKDEKKEKERIRQSVKKKGDERKVKWEKKVKEKEKEQWIELPFFFSMVFLFIPLSSLKEGGVMWWLTETRRWEWYSPPVELTLSSSQKVTVMRECGSHRRSHLSDLGSPDIGRGRRKWSQMIGGGPQTEVGFPSPQRK